jgi:hypothetical protein
MELLVQHQEDIFQVVEEDMETTLKDLQVLAVQEPEVKVHLILFRLPVQLILVVEAVEEPLQQGMVKPVVQA